MDRETVSAVTSALLGPQRLQALRRIDLRLSHRSDALDAIARCAERLLNVPVALVTLVSDTEVRVAGAAGIERWTWLQSEVPAEESFCQFVVADEAPVRLADTTEDARDLSRVAISAVGARAYLGVPLTTKQHGTLGAICALDGVPHEWSDEDIAILRDLATVAVVELERIIDQAETQELHDYIRAGIDLNPQIPWQSDPKGKRLTSVARLHELTGVPLGSASDVDWAAAIHPDDRATTIQAWRHAIRTETPYDWTHRVRHPDGTTLWVRCRVQPQRDANGTIVRWYGWTEDITDRKIAEREHSTLELLARSTVDGLWCWDFSVGELFLSPRCVELLGITLPALPVDRASIEAIMDCIEPADREAMSANAVAHMRRGALFEREVRVRHPREGLRWFWVRGQAQCDEHGTPLRFAGSISDVSARRAAEELVQATLAASRFSEARFRAAFEAFPGALTITDPASGRFLEYNDTACALLGYTREEFGALTIPDLEPPENRAEVARLIAEVAQSGQRVEKRRRHVTRTGELRDVQVSSRSFESDGRRLSLTSWIDVTEQVRNDDARRELEIRLRQAQKMEAVGQLAGGVAHDFNNLLTIISGNLEFLRTDLPSTITDDHPARMDVEEIAGATERARTLVRQLLAFSRQQPAQPQIFRLGDLVLATESMLRRLIGEEIVLATELDDEGTSILADRGQMEQVLMNLVVNARDAMLTARHGHNGTGGTLLISIGPYTLTPAESPNWDGMRPGVCVRLRVTDSGHGMDTATQARIFEPFFTTKPVGSGTGLGLATVFGVVRQAGGAVHVDSRLGAGTTFSVLLPSADATEARPAMPASSPFALPAQATILLVEDETPVRATARRMLERRGYTVLEARHGADALMVWKECHTVIDAVVTDLRMPEMGGRELADTLHADAPHVPIVFMSGYADRALATLDPAKEIFVEKPFTSEALTVALYRLLHRTHTPAR